MPVFERVIMSVNQRETAERTRMSPTKPYDLFDSPDIMGIGFLEAPLLNLNSLQLKDGWLYPGAAITHLGGRHTSAFFLVLDFKPALVYKGLYHTADERIGPLALFTCDGKPALTNYSEAYYCYHWLADSREFFWSNQRKLSGRTIETDKAVWVNP